MSMIISWPWTGGSLGAFLFRTGRLIQKPRVLAQKASSTWQDPMTEDKAVISMHVDVDEEPTFFAPVSWPVFSAGHSEGMR